MNNENILQWKSACEKRNAIVTLCPDCGLIDVRATIFPDSAEDGDPSLTFNMICHCHPKVEWTEETAKKALTDLLNDCLACFNQDQSFEVKGIDMEKRKFTVEFDIITVDEDNYIGFAGY